MQQQDQPGRPFGLMLLIGLSFGIAMWNLMAAAQFTMAARMKGHLPTDPGIDVAVLHSLWALPAWGLTFLVAAAVGKALLLFVAGWGYFTFRKLGRWAGSAYAVLSLAESGIAIAAFGYPVTVATMLGMLFALFTLLAVHGPFKALLVR